MIVVDDLGWADLGCYGSTYHRSPNVDRLATEGLRFTQAYAAAPVCSPTRAALLTGKSPARLDMTIWHEGAVDGGPRDRQLLPAFAEHNLPLRENTIAEQFRALGYSTAHIGKWHLGNATSYPQNHGFDVNIGGTFWGAPSTFFYPFRGAWNANDPIPRYVPDLAPGQAGDYLPDRLTDKTIEWLEQVGDSPFYIQLWFYTVHSPIEAPKALVDSIRQRPLGVHQKDPTYAGMVEQMDANVGRVLAAIDRLSLAEDTVIIFTSDNGGVDIPVRGILPTSNHPLRSGKGTLYEGGLRVPLIVRWPSRTLAAQTCDQPVTSQDIYPTLNEAFEFSSIQTPSDGVSLVQLFSQPTSDLGRQELHWHFPHYYPRTTPCSALRSDDWKLIHFYEDDRCELYDLAKDPAESTNVASLQTDVTARLKTNLDKWRVAIGANSPIKNPNAPD